MTKRTKTEIIEGFIKDLDTSNLILRSEAKLQDYVKLGEYFKMVGLSDDSIKDLYQGCGLNDWSELLDVQKKTSLSTAEMQMVACALGKIRGTTRGIVQALNMHLKAEEV